MSGLVGWVDYARDQRRERPVLRAMAGALAARGPDSEALWTAPHAGIGFRFLAVHGDSTPQPFTAHTADGPVTVCVTGAPTGVAELRARLAGRWAAPALETGVAGLIAHAYLAEGIAGVTRLTGAFAVALWDGRTEELLLVRDRLGTQPLFYHLTDSGMVFASERKALLAHPGVEAQIDLYGLRELFSCAGTAGHGIFTAVHQVRAGELVRFSRAGLTQHRYWRLTTAEHTDNLSTTVDTVRSLLQENVTGHFAGGDDLGIVLTGTLESSALAALAARTMSGGRLRTFTVTVAQQPGDPGSHPDARYVAEVVRRFGTDHTDVVLDTADVLDPLARALTLRAGDVPDPLGHTNTSTYLLCRDAGQQVRGVLTDELAEVIFGGYPGACDAPATDWQTLPWIALAHQRGGRYGFGADLLDPDLQAKLDLNGYCHDEWARSVADAEHLPGEDERDRRMRRTTYLRLTRWNQLRLTHLESLAMAAGVQARMPFSDHRLVEYAYNVPWAMKGFDGREQSLLRAAVGDLLPPSVRHRTVSPYPVATDPTYGQWLVDELSALLADSNSPATALVDRGAIRALQTDQRSLVSGPRAWVARAGAEMVLALDAWLRRYGVRVAL
ncbi:asparagine synthase (glutamine-hydrolyzing) [Actinoplanes sp. NPDC051859]|uniref:asparagine synthase (glutamine-hydrolyzing) n=1 Tax=Actinoplanes sp. NPDC051859 TaxID=3363909 RepID=UPI0037AD06B0